VVILVFVTELVYQLLHMQLNEKTKFCTGICFIPSLLNARWIWNSIFFLYAYISDSNNKMCACFELAMILNGGLYHNYE